MTLYEGDLGPKTFKVITATVVASGTATITDSVEINVARAAKPFLVVRAEAATGATGSAVVYYSSKIADLPYISSGTGVLTITMYETEDGIYYGYKAIENFDYSTIKVTSLVNDLSEDMTKVTILASGVVKTS